MVLLSKGAPEQLKRNFFFDIQHHGIGVNLCELKSSKKPKTIKLNYMHKITKRNPFRMQNPRISAH